MKNKRLLPAVLLIAIIVLTAALFVVGAGVQTARRVNVVGTFCTDPEAQRDARFLTLDRAGSYENYAPGDNAVSGGTYAADGRIITFAGQAGPFSGIYVEDTIYICGPVGGEITAYYRISDSVIYSK